MFTLRMLGGLLLTNGDEPVSGRAVQKRRLGLLSLLAVAPSRSCSRDKLIGYLWPDSSADQARHLLSVALYELRKTLGDGIVASRGDDVALPDAGLRTDVEFFEDALREGALERAVELYAGSFLDGFYLSDAPEFERWMERERDRLSRRYQGALERLASQRAEAGDRTGAAEAWRKLAAADPFNSRIALTLMESLVAAGDRAGALRHARSFAASLRAEFGAEPEPELTALADRLRQEPGPGATLPVNRLPGASESPPDGAWRTPSIAVFPLADVSPERDNQYFSDGLTEELIDALSQLEGLRVAARTSSFALRDRGLDVRGVGETLDVRWVLEGSVRKAGEQLRITARLIDVATGYEVWGESYDRTRGAVFEVQQELARAVVGAMRGHLTEGDSAALSRSTTPDVEAYTLYLKGRYHWFRRTPDGLRQALSYFERAVARDPTFAPAYLGIGDVYSLLGAHDYGVLPPAVAFPAAKRALGRALELDPHSAAACAALGNIHFTYDWSWGAAEEQFGRALELDPACAPAHHWSALGLLARGRNEEAMAAMLRARELEPLSMVLHTAMARLLHLDGLFDRAIGEYRRVLEMDPSFVTAHLGLGLSYVQSGAPELASEEYRTANRLLGREQPLVLALIAHADALAGQHEASRSALARLQAETQRSYVPAEYLGLVHLGLGERRLALDALECAFENRSGSMAFLRIDPLFDPLRGDPRFEELLNRVGL